MGKPKSSAVCRRPNAYIECFLSLIKIKVVPKTPAITSPKSSVILKLIAALNPTNDQSKGINIKYIGILLVVKNKIPKVKIVIGQGAPNVGDCG